jgi:hypothetical protein
LEVTDTGSCVIDGCAIPGRHADGCDDDGCGGCLVARASVGLVCRHHHRRLIQALAEMTGLYDELGDRLRPGGGNGPKITATFGHPLPIDTRVAAHREQIRHDLFWWSRLVADERGVHEPRATVPACGTFLATHGDWCAAQPWVDELLEVMLELRRDAFRLAYPDGRRRIVLGTCTESVDGQPCPGTLTATVRATDDLLPSVIACRTCGTEWTPDRWLTLGRRIHREAC